MMPISITYFLSVDVNEARVYHGFLCNILLNYYFYYYVDLFLAKGNGESLHYVTKAWQQGDARAQSTRVNIFYQFDLNSVR
jgi:hypothetical protein